jgi:hypothetical protein
MHYTWLAGLVAENWNHRTACRTWKWPTNCFLYLTDMIIPNVCLIHKSRGGLLVKQFRKKKKKMGFCTQVHSLNYRILATVTLLVPHLCSQVKKN